MLKIIVLVKRNPKLSPEEFQKHWRDVHAKLLRETPSVARHILRYEQNPRALEDYERGEDDFDGISIGWLRDRAAMDALFAEPEYAAKIAPDEEYLSDSSRNVWLVCDNENVVIDRMG